MSKVFHKALDAKDNVHLSSYSSPILAYGNVVGIQDIHEFNMKYANYKDIGHVGRQLTKLIKNVSSQSTEGQFTCKNCIESS